MLSPPDFTTYRRDGFIVLPDILTRDEVEALRHVTEEFVRNARSVAANDDIYDLEETHSAAEPRVRRGRAWVLISGGSWRVRAAAAITRSRIAAGASVVAAKAMAVATSRNPRTSLEHD